MHRSERAFWAHATTPQVKRWAGLTGSCCRGAGHEEGEKEGSRGLPRQRFSKSTLCIFRLGCSIHSVLSRFGRLYRFHLTYSTVGIGPDAPHVSLARSTWEDFYTAVGSGGQSQGEREQAYLTCSVCRGSHAQNSQPRHAVTPLYLQPIDTQPNGETCLLVIRV